MGTLLNEDKYRDYIINYLLINYGVRNADINLLITTDKSVTLKRNTLKQNYLYCTPRYIIYQRNDYKFGIRRSLDIARFTAPNNKQ